MRILSQDWGQDLGRGSVVVTTLAAAIVATMAVAGVPLRAGAAVLPLHPPEPSAHGLAGAAILACGILIMPGL